MSLVPHASCIQFIIVCANGVVQETHHTAEKCKSTVHADRDCHSSSLYISLLPFLAVLCRLIPHFCIDLHLCIGERFPWNFLQTFIGLREWNIMTSVIPWLYSQHQQQVKVFSNSVKYLKIYEMDWHSFLTQIFIVSRLWIIMALVKPLIICCSAVMRLALMVLSQISRDCLLRCKCKNVPPVKFWLNKQGVA